MTHQMSIMRFSSIQNIEELIASIESCTRGKVVKINEMFGQCYLTIQHHDGPICPSCGKDIHLYGHGLCWGCWQMKTTELSRIARGLKPYTDDTDIPF